MNRKDFTHTVIKAGLFAGLAGLTIVLGKKLVLEKDCRSCPDYAGCPGLDSCVAESIQQADE